jgi:hypothetical protein
MNHYSEQFEKYTMAGLKFWSCLFLLLVSFSSSETRSPAAFSDNGANQALIEGGKELFKARNERKVERPFESVFHAKAWGVFCFLFWKKCKISSSNLLDLQ